MKPRQLCELCEGEASLYCDADSAFLCRSCDRRVHAANFLVARHVRRLTCLACCTFDDPALSFSGPGGSYPIRSLCRSCHPDPISSSSTSSSSCISTDESDPPPPTPTRRRSAAARVMESWSRRMGLTSGRLCADVAAHVMQACGGRMAAMPLRAAMAASLWFAARVCGRTCEGMLRRLEKCSGVPAKVIVFHESRIARAVGRRREAVGECN